jgi:hypothetical protein
VGSLKKDFEEESFEEIDEDTEEEVEKKEYKKEEVFEGEQIGKVTHFFNKISVVVIELTAGIKVGDRIRIKGHEADFEQPIDSMQIEHVNVKEAKKGQSIGMKVIDKAHEGAIVYKV